MNFSERLWPRLRHFPFHRNQHLRNNRLESIFAGNNEHRPWNWIRRRRNCPFPFIGHSKWQSEGIARSILSPKFAQFDEFACHRTRFCRRHIFSGNLNFIFTQKNKLLKGIPRWFANQKCPLPWPTQLLPNQIILHQQHPNHPSICTRLQSLCNLTNVGRQIWGKYSGQFAWNMVRFIWDISQLSNWFEF